MRFSARFAATKGTQLLVLEDAPRPTRIGYIKGILGDFVGATTQPLSTYGVHQEFIALVRDEANPSDYDPYDAWEALTYHLKQCSWLEFYDFVELVGGLLLAREDDDPFSEDYYKNYQARLNALLQEDSIGWSLDNRSHLTRQIPKALAKRVKLTEDQLSDKFATARVHYQKAVTYLYQHPIDEANSVKEIVSALESVAKVIVPQASTLGDAIKTLRKDSAYSAHLLDALEKLYVYSNATPLIRHGHATPGRPSLPEAELSLHIGVAFIRYLINAGEGRI
jgi:hypothetical protein